MINGFETISKGSAFAERNVSFDLLELFHSQNLPTLFINTMFGEKSLKHFKKPQRKFISDSDRTHHKYDLLSRIMPVFL